MWEPGAVLILVRHGRTEANREGLLLGRSDPPLDDVGRHQAIAVAKLFHQVDRVITSPLLRARQTADALGIAYDIDERWVELDYGAFDGRRAGDLGSDVWERWRADPAYVPAGGESLEAMGARVMAACEELVEEATTRDVVVVSHVSPIKAAVAWALDVGASTAWRTHLDNASVTRIRVNSRGPTLWSFNETGHLLPTQS